jgi:collagenase-like PrtC family protease
MKLSLPCNWNLDLIEATRDLPVHDFYGAMNTTPVGHARSAFIIPEVSEEKVVAFIKRAHALGRQFSYVLNAPNMANLEFDPRVHRRLLDYFQWLVDIEVDAVHVANPYLMEVIIEQFPALEVNASVICGICSPEMAAAYQKMGVASLNVGLEVNRDFAALRAIRKAVSVPVILIPNLADLRQCPFRNYHYSMLGHTTQSSTPEKAWRSWAMDPCTMQCNEKKLSEPVELIKSCFVRPEDLAHYDPCVDIYKLSGRHQNTRWITATATAYASRNYNGNLVDILDTVILNTNHVEQLHLEFINKSDPEILAVPAFYAWAGFNYKVSDAINIDNKKLDGFIRHFVEDGCNPRRWCGDCGYCGPWADKAVTINREIAEAYLRNIRNHRKALRSSAFASPGVSPA